MIRNSIHIAICLVLFLAGCVTTVPGKEADREEALQKESADFVPGADGSSDDPVYRMKEYYEQGMDKIDGGYISEGIRLLVSVLAENENKAKPSEEAETYAEEAEIELNKLKSSLSLDVDENEWVDEKGNQKHGSTLNLEVVPSVRLTYNVSGSKWIVANAPVTFKFIKGGGIISGSVNTNELGQASCKVAKFDNANTQNIIRASIVVREKGYTYTFEGLNRDFLFEPPANRATILVLEKSEEGEANDPVIFDPVYNKLKDVAFDFTMYNGSLMGKEFMKIYGGDTKSIKKLSLEKGVSYLVVVLNDCFNVAQLEFRGKKLKGFISEARATLRVIRVADGKVLFETRVTLEKAKNTHAQGGSKETAIINALRGAAELMEKKLGDEIPKIKKIMTGE
ncbi:MAG: hypothetical protein JW969_04325 [Spirochaetales bacterium]|nr:hypothetical protein [Spirochaetales bacterium]